MTQLSSIQTKKPLKTFRFARVSLQLVRERTFTITAPQITCPFDVANVVTKAMKKQHGLDSRESLFVIHLNTPNRVLAIEPVATGSTNTTGVVISEIFRGALVNGATAIILAHNHPGGDPTPSPEDVQITRRVIEVGQMLGLEVLDHIVFTDMKHVSLKERGLAFG